MEALLILGWVRQVQAPRKPPLPTLGLLRMLLVLRFLQVVTL
jgi:hypothetical protein